MQLCGFDVGLDRPFFLIAGTCAIESLQMSLDVAGTLKEACTALGIPLIYKGSFDKANRSSGTSQRGVGIAVDTDKGLLVPVIKDAAWPQEMRRSVGEGAAEQVVEDFNGDLVIVYAEDTPSNTRYFSPGDLEDAGIERSGLRTLAVANLRQLLPPVDVHNGPLVSMLTAGGDYVASLLLMEELSSGEKLSVDGDIVNAVPTRDVV